MLRQRPGRPGRRSTGSSGGVDPVTGDPIEAQVYLYDPAAFDGDGAVAISAGNLDTADNVAVVVPGLRHRRRQRAATRRTGPSPLYEASRSWTPDETNATMFWIGYDAPDNLPLDEGWTPPAW